MSSSTALGSSSKREAQPFKNRVKIISSIEAYGTTKTEPWWPAPEWGDRTDIQNVNEKTCEGVIVPAGTMFPLGAAIPCDTVLTYGAYFPAGTMFPDGVLIPIHSRLVSSVPLETLKVPDIPKAIGCSIM